MARRIYFYDAAAPIIDVNTIDMTKVYLKSAMTRRSGLSQCSNASNKNLWFTKLVNAEGSTAHLWEENALKKSHAPIEVMAKRGIKTMLYGPMKPAGLEYPDDYQGPRDRNIRLHAVVQLRQDNAK